MRRSDSRIDLIPSRGGWHRNALTLRTGSRQRAWKHDVDLWRIQADPDHDTLDLLRGVLSTEEHDRAERFKRSQDRLLHIVAHGALRMILASQLAVAPSRVAFERRVHGKPRLRRSEAEPDLRFSLSHSGTQVLVAVARGFEVGVDIEATDRSMVIDELTESVLSPSELNALQEVPPAGRSRWLYQVWTRKEAVLKAIGLGLTVPMNGFSTGWPLNEATHVMRLPPEHGASRQLAVQDVRSPHGYAASLAAETPATHAIRRASETHTHE